jgi:hypothetical protein
MKPGVCSATLWKAALGCVLALGSGAFASSAMAQQSNAVPPKPTTAATYDVTRETVLQGTVVTFTANSTATPFGAHVVLETSSGEVDVHLGDARLLASKNLSLNAGDAVKIVGENLASGGETQFVARVVQKGDQTVAVRSVRGFPIKPLTKPAGGAL